MEIGLPTKSSSFFAGQDVLYGQFNDINFYVEDEDQESFYETILKKLFPDIKIEKIFPLGGKDPVIKAAKLTTTDKKKVYIVDKDFDDILKTKEAIPNLFYLKQYSIENYLTEETAIQKLIIEEKPKLKAPDVAATFSLTDFQKETRNLFSEIICSYLVIQKHCLGIPNVSYEPARFCNLNNPSSIKTADFNTYKASIEVKLKTKSKKLSLVAQIKQFKKYCSKKIKVLEALRHIPGKYTLHFLKARVRHLFSIPSFHNMTLESLSIRLADKCTFDSLVYLRTDIQAFIA
ncbi:DUF4435 domain-containing protein [Flavobacterium sp.]|uniref:DUF4435 domain-containing protein n=1 Tax=Flavobacterium sp. TaxID=239 RepID=UPI003753D675